MLVALGYVAETQYKGNETTKQYGNQLLDYCSLHPEATVCMQKSDMILKYTAMPLICCKPSHETDPEDNFTWGWKHMMMKSMDMSSSTP